MRPLCCLCGATILQSQSQRKVTATVTSHLPVGSLRVIEQVQGSVVHESCYKRGCKELKFEPIRRHNSVSSRWPNLLLAQRTQPHGTRPRF
jgi:hypothetical protein